MIFTAYFIHIQKFKGLNNTLLQLARPADGTCGVF